MFSLNVLVPLAFAGFVSAQAQINDATTGIAAIEAHIKQSGISPATLPQFNPSAVLNVNFEGTAGQIQPGQKLTVPEVQPTPQLTLTPANSTVTFTGDYTVAMVDADIVGAPQQSITRHWLVNNAKIENNAVTFSDAVYSVTEYGAPLPAEGSGAHRYVLLVFAQPEGFTPPVDPAQNAGISAFDFQAYVTAANLGSPIAANYIQVEQGTATASVSATQAVQSATLAAAASSGAPATGSGAPSGSRSASAGASPSATAGPGNSAASVQGGSFAAAFAGVAALMALV